MLLSFVIPAYNEDKWILDLLEKVSDLELIAGCEKEIIVIDDGSSDKTNEYVRKYIEKNTLLNISLYKLSQNLGKGAAVRLGIKESKGDIIIIQDADLEYSPCDVNNIIKPILCGFAKVVYGSRILGERRLNRSSILGFSSGKHPNAYILAYLGGLCITFFINNLMGSKLTDEPTCYKCFLKSTIDDITIDCDDFTWEPEVTVKLLKKGIDIIEVPISYNPRNNSDGKKIKWFHGIRALRAIYKYS
jgi:dolichol-phosphate mannosyltransferase